MITIQLLQTFNDFVNYLCQLYLGTNLVRLHKWITQQHRRRRAKVWILRQQSLNEDVHERRSVLLVLQRRCLLPGNGEDDLWNWNVNSWWAIFCHLNECNAKTSDIGTIVVIDLLNCLRCHSQHRPGTRISSRERVSQFGAYPKIRQLHLTPLSQ